MTAQIQGRPAGARIDSLDVLRGFAILGILVMNIQAFSMVTVQYVNPTLAGPMMGLDLWLWLIAHVGFENKFIAIFSALFGAGIVLMAERAELSGAAVWGRHLRRMFVLGLFGLGHAYLIWYGDILFIYAVIGSIAFLFRNLSLRGLLTLAGLVYLFPLAFAVAMTVAFLAMPQVYYDALVTQYWQPTSPEIAGQEAAYRGGWSEQMGQRVSDAMTLHLGLLPLKDGWRVLALMLAGMAAYRSGLLTGDWSERRYARTGLLGLAIGLPLALGGVWFHFATGWEMATSLFLGAAFNHLAAPFIALAWGCGLLIVFNRGWLAWLLERFRAVGRTALTCYLLTSVICTSIFYGHGLGLFGQVTRGEQWLIMLGVWVLLIAFATLWLRWFRQGPVEWLWRVGVYGGAALRPRRRGPPTDPPTAGSGTH